MFSAHIKVEKSAFASDTSIRQMMTRMEDMYATAFGMYPLAEMLVGVLKIIAHTAVRGNKKKAMKRLRVGNNTKNHHFSSFRAGLVLGLALPAFVDGMVKGNPIHNNEYTRVLSVLFIYQPFSLKPTKRSHNGVSYFTYTAYCLCRCYFRSLWASTCWCGRILGLIMCSSSVRPTLNYLYIMQALIPRTSPELDVLTQIGPPAYFEVSLFPLGLFHLNSICFAPRLLPSSSRRSLMRFGYHSR